ncbi:MAG: DUF4105 domain-containing protein, partial [Gemmatimonadales bacterium]
AAPLAGGPAELRVYLMTMGPGAQVWERFGHNAIWIEDPSVEPDTAYNYGLFDFQQENFLLRFARGEMWYWMAGFSAEAYVQSYVRDNRSVWLQELNLPPAARIELRRFLRWNELPANRFYHYDYYDDNCSTRVRDAIDRVIGGSIRQQTSRVPSGTTYRFHTQRLTANDPAIFTALLLALGQRVDRPISKWQEMFLPMAMREHVRRVTVTYPDGSKLPLVAGERTLFESSAPDPPESPPSWLGWYLLAGVGVGLLIVSLGLIARPYAVGRFGLGTLVTLWGVAGGLSGLVLAGLWALTDHTMSYRNENLLQLNPVILALAWLAPKGLAGSIKARRWARTLSLWLAGLAVLGAVLQVLPGFDQVNGQVIALALPIHLGVAAGLRRARRGTT